MEIQIQKENRTSIIEGETNGTNVVVPVSGQAWLIVGAVVVVVRAVVRAVARAFVVVVVFRSGDNFSCELQECRSV